MKAILLLAGLAATSIVSASAISVNGVDWSRGENVNLVADGILTHTWAGSIQTSIDGIGTYPVLCVDLFTHVSLGDSYNVNYVLPASVDPNDASRGLRAAYLFVTQFSAAADPVHGAALQLAIWEIIHDGGRDGVNSFTSGRIQQSVSVGASTDSAIRDAALQYIQVALDYQSGPAKATIFQHVDGPLAKQQLMGLYIDPGNTGPVPEPASVALVGGAIGLLGWRHARNRKK